MNQWWPALVLIVLFGEPPTLAVAQLQVKEIKRVPFWAHTGGLSVDGNLYARLHDGNLFVHDWATLKLLSTRAAPGPKPNAENPVFSPDGKFFAYVCTDPRGFEAFVSLWDTKSWKQAAILRVPARRLAFSPDSKVLAVQLEEKGLPPQTSIWELKGERGVRERALIPGGSGTPGVGPPTFSPDGKLLFTGRRFWNTETEQWWEFPGGKSLPEGVAELNDVAFSPDSKIFFASSWGRDNGNSPERGFKFWDITTGRELATAKLKWLTPSDQRRPPLFSPDGKLVVVQQTWDKSDLIEVATGERLATVAGSPLRFSQDGKSLTSLGNREVIIWVLSWMKEPPK